MTHHIGQLEQKKSLIKLENIEKAKKAKDWKNFKWNNAQTARYQTIKQRYLSPEPTSSKLIRSPMRSSYQQLPTYMLHKNKPAISKNGNLHLSGTVRN